MPMRYRLCGILIGFVALGTDVHAITPFVHEVVDSAGSVGSQTSLAIDSRGNPHISYYDAVGNVLYAVHQDGAWMIDTIPLAQPDCANTDRRTSIVLDANDQPHIACGKDDCFDVAYATKSGGVWTTEMVYSTLYPSYFQSIALDPSGVPHIAFGYNGDFPRVVLTSRTGGSWSNEIVASPSSVGGVDLAIDAVGRPNVVYYNGSSLVHLMKTGGSWTSRTVDSSANVGEYPSLALDSQGTPHVSYYDVDNKSLKYAYRIAPPTPTDPDWAVETVHAPGLGPSTVGRYSSLALDENGGACISYHTSNVFTLAFATNKNGMWAQEFVEIPGLVGLWTSLALDRFGNPMISYYDSDNQDLRLSSSGLRLASPSAGESWPVGGQRTVSWRGAGTVDIELSTDGGSSYTTLASSVLSAPFGKQYEVTVPHVPSSYCKMRVVRESPYAAAESESLFTITSTVSLLSMTVSHPADSGNLISWRTWPGPEDLAGYRLERQNGPGSWVPVVMQTKNTRHLDTDGATSDRYRLFAINNFGDEQLLAERGDETSPQLPPRLHAWPVPYQAGDLNIAFATPSGLGGGTALADVAVYDIQGKLVRRIARGQYEAGVHTAHWDGRSESGKPVPSGVYFIRAMTGGVQQSRKFVVIR